MDINDAVIIKNEIYKDNRGFFTEVYHKEKFDTLGLEYNFVQSNLSSSRKGVLRGLHYQVEPMAQTKMVKVVYGVIFDVLVDMRRGSSDFGKYKAFILSAENQDQVIVPKGFAHGFYVLSDRADVLYMLDNLYSQKHERTLLWNDHALNIPWIFYDDPIISGKDSKGILFENSDYFE